QDQTGPGRPAPPPPPAPPPGPPPGAGPAPPVPHPASEIRTAAPCRRAPVSRQLSRVPRARSHRTHSVTSANRSGRSVSGVTRTSPRRPWGRAISPITTRRWPTRPLLLRGRARGRRGRRGRVRRVRDQLADRVRRLGALLDPLVHLRPVDRHRRRLAQRAVVPEHLDESAVAR